MTLLIDTNILLDMVFKRPNCEKGKKLFLFYYPHTLTIRLKRPVYRGFKGEGKGEGVRVKMMV